MKVNKFFKNLSWIFVGNVLHAVLSFLLNVIVARVLTKEDFGIVNYAASCISFFSAISVLGLNNIVNKYFAEESENSGTVLGTVMITRVISSILSILVVAIFFFIFENGNITIISVSIIQSFSLLFSVGDTLVYWFRHEKKANVVAVLRLISFGVSSVIKILSILVFKNIQLYVVGVVSESLFFSLLLFIYSRVKHKIKYTFSKIKLIDMLKISYPFIFSNILVIIYAQTDKIMLKNMIGNEEVASYSVCVTIAGIISVIVSALIEGFRPELFSQNNINKDKYYKRLRQLYFIIFWMCIFYGVFVTIFAKDILFILYGEKYVSANVALSTIVWYTSFSYFGAINNIHMVVINRQKYVQVTTFIGAIINIILNLILIRFFGIVGAAVASLITQFIANFFMMFIIRDLRPLFYEIVKGIINIDTFNFKKGVK